MSSPFPRNAGVRNLVTGALIVWLSAAAWAADGPPALEPSPAQLARGVPLCGPWLYRAGDDPGWADPALDERGWSVTRPSQLGVDEIPEGWRGVGWFRLRVSIPATEDDLRLGLLSRQAGALEVWIDGTLQVTFGRVSSDPTEEVAVLPAYAAPVSLADGEHLLAVRYSNARNHLLPGVGRGFCLQLGDTRAVAPDQLRQVRQEMGFLVGIIGLFGAFALLHLLLFVWYPPRRENLFFALFALSIVGLMATEIGMLGVEELSRQLVRYKVARTLSVCVALSALLLSTVLFRRRVGRGFALFAVAAGGVVAWVWTRSAIGDVLPLLVFLALAYFETIRQGLPGVLRRRGEAWMVGLGFLLLAGTFLVSALGNLGLIQPPGVPLIAGIGGLALSFSVYLTRDIAKTNRELATRLAQVDQLTARTVEQERKAARDEAERRLLDAENRRKQAELEEARRLQLAMLPHEAPRLAGFEIAIHMTTANEVGGDYYDFATDRPDQGILVVGDATGHGLRAGMVVAVVKSLFQAHSGERRLETILERIGSALHRMRHRAAAMALLLIRVRGRELEIASAGIPPVLIWRAATRRVEELLLTGVPLGTLLEADFSRQQTRLEEGDSLLAMTDGLVEAVGPDGEQVGYERATEWFAEVAHRPPQQIVDRLSERVVEFLGGEPLPDDMTLVALTARGGASPDRPAGPAPTPEAETG